LNDFFFYTLFQYQTVTAAVEVIEAGVFLDDATGEFAKKATSYNYSWIK
jgi:hypothetical protein